MPDETTREGIVKLYGPYTATYTGVRPCPYRVQRNYVEVFSCAMASQVSAYVGRQDDGYPATDAELTALLALATPAPAREGKEGEDDKATPSDLLCRWTRASWNRLIEFGRMAPQAPLVIVLSEAQTFAGYVRRLLARLDNDELTSEHLALLHPAPASGGTVTEAARALVAKLNEVHADPRYMAIWYLAAAHGAPYDGPKYEAELQALTAALAERTP